MLLVGWKCVVRILIVVHHGVAVIMNKTKIILSLILIVLVIPVEACANAIIPYMAVPWGQLFLLPLVIIIEGFILRKLAGGSLLSTLFQSLTGNIVSTALGAAIYLATIEHIYDQIFTWWFKGSFASEALRNVCIALGFALTLYVISWVSETIVISRMRKTTFKEMAIPCALANLATYILLMVLAIWLQK